jgi:C-terminal processing protease CtpA/Prc
VGLKVTLVPEDGPAGKAGFKEGDVVAAVDGQKIETYDAFRTYWPPRSPVMCSKSRSNGAARSKSLR